MTPVIVTITGPACSGKSTLEAALAKRGFGPVIGTTTRAPRHGEQDGVDYHFLTRHQFAAMQLEGGFIETCEFNGNLYGTTVDKIARIANLNMPATVVCEPQGQHNIAEFAKARGWGLVSVFVDCPTISIATRYLERFLKEIKNNSSEKAIESYARRLATLIDEELTWKKRAEDYTLYIPSYDGVVSEEVVQMIIEQVCTNS